MSRGESDKRAKLITLLNVAHARTPGKRKGEGEDWHEIAKRARKSSTSGTRAVSSKAAAGAAVIAGADTGDGDAEDIEDVPGTSSGATLKEDDEDADEDEDEDGDEKSGARAERAETKRPKRAADILARHRTRLCRSIQAALCD